MRYPTAGPTTWALAAVLAAAQAGGVAAGPTVQGQSDQSGAGAIRTAEAPSHSDSAAARTAEPQAPPGVPAPSTTFRDCSDCPEMVAVPAGKFMMGWDVGDPDEKPAHEVVIAKPLAVGKFEVTYDEFNACEADGGCKRFKDAHFGGSKGRRPITNITWNEARGYAAWLSKKTGKLYRLLSEAEWEYAARAGTTTKYAFGDIITHDQANFSYGKQGEGRTKEVGSYPPNAWGLYDMHGNVWEWVEDCYGTYQGAPADGTARISSNCASRVLRGGSWDYEADEIRSSVRYKLAPDWWSLDETGFRVARSLE
jgi:formylglycine-generating enzyme required for sulfatase activity